MLALGFLLFCAFGLSRCNKSATQIGRPVERPLDRALKAIHMRRADLAIDVSDLPVPQPARFLRQGLLDPLTMISAADSLALEVERDSSTASVLRMAIRLADASADDGGGQRPPVSPVEAVSRLYRACGLYLTPAEARSMLDSFQALPPAVQEAAGALADGVAQGRTLVEGALGRLTEEDRKVLPGVASLMTGSMEEARARRVSDIAAKVDLGRMASAALCLAGSLETASALAGVVDSLEFTVRDSIPGVSGDVLAALESPAGALIVGGPGRTVYERPAAVILDVGGDDVYCTGAPPAADLVVPAVSVLLDLGCDDQYVSGSVASPGVGLMGVGALVDLCGNDRYESRGQGSQGCGLAGVGLLIDRRGDDRYEGGAVCQGAGVFGVGVLADEAGEDTYRAGAAAQGYGGPGGCGILIDRAGSDLYRAGGMLPDFREAGRFQSLSQGYGTGIRPFAAGGIGVLVDLMGDDAYEGDYFAQGSGFWMGLGMLIDRKGGDRYVARRYSQGSGSHLATGALLDQEGDDVYQAWGVSQGCGHDLSLGLLVDRLGNDRYETTWLSQGAGSANGVGLLIEGTGADRYVGERDVQGAGVEDRGFGSIGLLLDGGGVDAFSGQGQGDGMRVRGEYGVCVDTEEGPLW